MGVFLLERVVNSIDGANSKKIIAESVRHGVLHLLVINKCDLQMIRIMKEALPYTIQLTHSNLYIPTYTILLTGW